MHQIFLLCQNVLLILLDYLQSECYVRDTLAWLARICVITVYILQAVGSSPMSVKHIATFCMIDIHTVNTNRIPQGKFKKSTYGKGSK